MCKIQPADDLLLSAQRARKSSLSMPVTTTATVTTQTDGANTYMFVTVINQQTISEAEFPCAVSTASASTPAPSTTTVAPASDAHLVRPAPKYINILIAAVRSTAMIPLAGVHWALTTTQKTVERALYWASARIKGTFDNINQLRQRVFGLLWAAFHAVELQKEVQTLRNELKGSQTQCEQLKSQNAALATELQRAEERCRTLRTHATTSRDRVERAMQNLNRNLTSLPALMKETRPVSMATATPGVAGVAMSDDTKHGLSKAA